MFVNACIINRKEKKNPSQIIIGTFAILFSLFLKFSLYVIILFYRPNTALQKAFIIKYLSFKFKTDNYKFFKINFLLLKDILIKYIYLRLLLLKKKKRIRLVQFNDQHQIFFFFFLKKKKRN